MTPARRWLSDRNGSRPPFTTDGPSDGWDVSVVVTGEPVDGDRLRRIIRNPRKRPE
jgi:hypothetical protein